MKVKFLGGVLVLVAVAAIVVWLLWPQPPPLKKVTGFAGASKAALLQDLDVKNTLSATSQLEVTFKTGSQVCDTLGDFFWPGAEFAVEEYEECKGIAKADADSVLTSPLVFYTWDEVANALVREKLVEVKGGVYYATDLPRLFQMLHEHKKWKDIGVDIVGDVAVIPAEPTTADSGLLFAAMMANTKLDGIANAKTLPPVLPEIVEYFKSLGFLQPSTDALFKAYLAKGMGAYPIIVAYESLLPSLIYDKSLNCAKTQKMRVIYPEPTVWASHPMIAETPNGRTLINALREDAGIQKIAWERYGFRTFEGAGTPSKSMCLPMPAEIKDVTQLPDFKTMSILEDALKTRGN